MIRFGERIALTTGEQGTLEGFQRFDDGTAKAFVRFDKPIQTEAGGKTLGLSDRAWVEADGFEEVRDHDGCLYGMKAKRS